MNQLERVWELFASGCQTSTELIERGIKKGGAHFYIKELEKLGWIAVDRVEYVGKKRGTKTKFYRVTRPIPPKRPVPASVFHLGPILAGNQREWKAVNESFRRAA